MKHEVAVIYNARNEIVGAYKCKMVEEDECKRLIEESKKREELKENTIHSLEKVISELDSKIKELEKEIRVLKGEEE